MYIIGDAQVPADYVLQHRTLSTRLTPYYHDLRQIDRILHADGRENILELIDQSGRVVSKAAQSCEEGGVIERNKTWV